MSGELYRNVLIAAQLALLGWIVLHDLRTLIVPNRYVYPAIGLSLLAIIPLGASVVADTWLGALAVFAVLLLLAVISRGAMGLGDTKVGAFCGAIVGLQGATAMLALTFVGGALVSLGLILARVRDRKDAIAFTPFMLVAVVGTLVLAGS